MSDRKMKCSGHTMTGRFGLVAVRFSNHDDDPIDLCRDSSRCR
jgi:hypothetical protein